MLIENLPVELVLLLLRGSSIADILSFTWTSSYFRSISLANRRLWIDASDSYRIQLPLGETLRTTNLSLLPRNAARSVSIASRWRHRDVRELIYPKRTYEAPSLYNLPAWSFWGPLKYSQRSFAGHAPPAFMNILPGGRAFLFGSVAHLGIYDLCGHYGHELDVPFCARFDPPSHPGDTPTAVDWDSVDNGAHITVVVLSKTFNERRDVESILSVFAVDYSRSANEPCIRRTHVFTLPISAAAVSIKGPLILVRSSGAFLLINLQSQQRGCWVLRGTDFDLASAILDPARNSVILVFHSLIDDTRSLQVFDVPAAMESFEQTFIWAYHLFAPGSLAHPPWKPPSCPTIEFVDSDSATFREATLTAGGKLLLSSVPIDLRSPGPSARLTTLKAIVCEPANVAVLRSAHHRPMLATVGKSEVMVLPSTPVDDVLRLAFPADRIPGMGRALAFDEVYGIMLAFARGRLFVMQY